jgi:hypothetical protein
MLHIPSLTWCSWTKPVNRRKTMHALSEFGRLWKDNYLLSVFNLVAAGLVIMPAMWRVTDPGLMTLPAMWLVTDPGLVTLPATWRVTDPDDSNERSCSICKGWEVLFFKTRTNNILEDHRPAHKRSVHVRSGQRDVQTETNSRNSKRGYAVLTISCFA